VSIDKLKTKFFTGAWLTDVKHYFTKINEIIDYLNGTSRDGSYKVYTVNLTSQAGPTVPKAVILNNTLNRDIIWSYVGIGVYKITLPFNYNPLKHFIIWGIGDSNAFGAFNVVKETNVPNELTFYFVKSDTLFPENGLLSGTAFEFRSYN
jgi:hypothetical protein